MRFDVLTIFPELFPGPLGHGVIGRALERELIQLHAHNIRDHAELPHWQVDDEPFGGGAGMVFKPEPLARAIDAVRMATDPAGPVVFLSPQGEPLTHAMAADFATAGQLTLVCGRYEGIDERVIESQVDEELSLGDFVLSGGELAAMACLDAIIRLQPGALGHEDSADQDSFMNGLLDCTHYTRPEEYAGKTVPPVLLSGDHEAIRVWRLKQSLGRTWLRRPDLLKEFNFNNEQTVLLEEFIVEHESKLKK